MAGVTSLFKKIDETLFKQIDVLKNNRAYQVVLSKLSELPEVQQRLVGQILTFSVIVVPLVVLTVTFVGNYQLRQEIETRKNILNLIHQYAAQKGQLIEIGNGIASPIEITNSSDASAMIKNILDRKKIDTKKVAVENFQLGTALKGLSMAEVDINFKDFSINDLTNFMQILLQEKRSKVARLSIQKDSNNNFLTGVLHLVHYSRPSGSGSNEN